MKGGLTATFFNYQIPLLYISNKMTTMTLYEIVNEILDIAQQQPNINYTGEGDIYSLNSLPNIDYSVFFITQSEHTQSEDTSTYNLILYHIDRLLTDGSNRLQVQSQSMLAIQNVINIFNQMNPDVQVDYDVRYTTFTHRFQDECAGAFANVTITVDNDLGICGYE